MKANFTTNKGRTKLVLQAETNAERVMMTDLLALNKLEIIHDTKIRIKPVKGKKITEALIEKVIYLNKYVLPAYGFTAHNEGGGQQFINEDTSIGLFGYGTMAVVAHTIGAIYDEDSHKYAYQPSSDPQPVLLGYASTTEELEDLLDL